MGRQERRRLALAEIRRDPELRDGARDRPETDRRGNLAVTPTRRVARRRTHQDARQRLGVDRADVHGRRLPRTSRLGQRSRRPPPPLQPRVHRIGTLRQHALPGDGAAGGGIDEDGDRQRRDDGARLQRDDAGRRADPAVHRRLREVRAHPAQLPAKDLIWEGYR